MAGTGILSSPVWVLGFIPTNPFRWFFLWLQVVSLHAYTDQYSTEYLRGTLCRSFKFYLCSCLPSGTLPMNSSCLGFFLRQLACIPLLEETTWFCVDSHTPHHSLLTFSRQQTGIVVKLTLFAFCLSGIIVLYCLISNAMKTIVSRILPGFLVVIADRINLVPITPSCLEAEVRTMDVNGCVSFHWWMCHNLT